MSYASGTDFLALMRQNSDGVRMLRMPGLDYVVAAMARAGMFLLWVSQTAPTVNQNTTVWFKPSSTDWAAEGAVFLYNASTGVFEPATPELWAELLVPLSGTVFQAIVIGADAINNASTLVAIERNNPATTLITMPVLASRNDRPVSIVDWSTNVVNHTYTFSTSDGTTIMRKPTLSMYSNSLQLSGVTLRPSTDLNGWIVA